MGSIGNFVENIIKAPEAFGDSIINTATGVTEAPKLVGAVAKKVSSTTQFFDPDRGAKTAAARKAAGKTSLRNQFKIELDDPGTESRKTRGGLTIS